MKPKTFEFPNGTVTLHGWDRWPTERLAPLLERYVRKTQLERREKDAA